MVAFKERSCARCLGEHDVDLCKEFLALSKKERWAFISEKRLCFVCLRSGHRAGDCRFKKPCGEDKCIRMHHRLLHAIDERPKLNASCQLFSKDHGVILGVVPVIIDGPNGSFHASALLDTGADTSLIRENLVQKLGLNGTRENINLSTPIGNTTKSCTRVSFRIRSVNGLEAVDVTNAYSVESILDVDAASPSKATLSKWSHLNDVPLTPIANPVVGILLGLDVPEVHWVLEQRRGRKGDPYADHTPLGWVLRGPLTKCTANHVRAFALRRNVRTLEEDLRRFYDADFVDRHPFEISPSVEDERAVDMAERST